MRNGCVKFSFTHLVPRWRRNLGDADCNLCSMFYYKLVSHHNQGR
jgi:hypothetical protein